MAVYSLRMLRTLLTFSFFVVEVLSQHKKIVRQAWVHGVAFGGDLGGDWMGPCRPRLGRAAFPTTKRWDHSSRALRPATLQKQTEGCLVDAVAQGLLKASQRLVLGQKA
ncbi:unnamed protein product, partial [Durusdinium trenchii]